MPPLRTIALLTLFAHPLLGGVVLDGSFGTKGALPSINNNFTIQSTFGKQVGSNLFQSFSQFNLNNSQSATFMGPSNVHNILARVTSGSPSSIDGTIRSDIQGATLFFMNPAGVLFGQHAHLDVSGSFAVTTANYLNLVGGGRFNADLGGGDVLTSAPVSAFGFLNSTPAGVSITGTNTRDSKGDIVPGQGLTVLPGKSVSVVAGNIAINAGYINGARVNFVSVKSAGEAKLNATDIDSAVDVSQFSAMGTINLTNLVLVDTSGPLGGPVIIRGGNLNLDNSQIASDTLSSAQSRTGGTIDIDMTGTITISPGGLIRTRTYGKGNAGDVTIAADSLLIDAGDVEGGAGIFARAENRSTGHGGNIAVQVHNVKMTNAGRIAATTSGDGNAGDIHVTADSLLIGGGLRSAIAANGEIGKGGNVTVTADNVKLTGNARIAAITQGSGDAGDVTVKANSLLIDGTGLSAGNTGIVADVEAGKGNGGSVTIQAHDVKLVAGGLISARTLAKGQGGNVMVNADSVLIDGAESSISAVAKPDSSGTGGDVFVSADDLLLQNGGNVSAASFTAAEAGSVHLSLGTLTMHSGSSISSANTGSGGAGSVAIDTTGPVKLRHGSSISTSSNVGDAGTIDLISGGEIRLRDRSSISVQGGRNGGDITVKAPVLVSLFNSDINAKAGNTGGNIAIDSIALQLKNSTIKADATLQGGHIDLFLSFLVGPVKTVTSDGSLLLAFNSSITATGGTANGAVNVSAPALDLGAELIVLPTSLLSVESQLQERCTALLRGDFSSFISIGRGGTEPAPEELQSTF